MLLMLWQYPAVSRPRDVGLARVPGVLLRAVPVAVAPPRPDRMTPVPVHAFNPGPMTGDGNWTWLLTGTRADAHRRRHGRPAASRRRGAGACRCASGAGARDARARRSCVRSVSRSPSVSGARFLKMPWPERDSRWPVRGSRLAMRQLVEAGDDRLRAVHTPGHAPDHLCFWHEESRTLFSGDLAVKGTTVYIPPNLQGDLARLPGLARARASASAGAAASGAWPGDRRSRRRAARLPRASP